MKTKTTFPKPIRIIQSNDAKYALLDEGMYRLHEASADGYSVLKFSEPSLSRAVVRKIFKLGKGRTRQGWRFNTAADHVIYKLMIGCQYFDQAAVLGLKRWLGI